MLRINVGRLMSETGVPMNSEWADAPKDQAGSSLGTVFGQKRNLVRPAFWRMLADLVRFNRLTTQLALSGSETQLREPIGDFLQRVIDRIVTCTCGQFDELLGAAIAVALVVVEDAPAQRRVGGLLVGPRDGRVDAQAARIGFVAKPFQSELARHFGHVFGMCALYLVAGADFQFFGFGWVYYYFPFPSIGSQLKDKGFSLLFFCSHSFFLLSRKESFESLEESFLPLFLTSRIKLVFMKFPLSDTFAPSFLLISNKWFS